MDLRSKRAGKRTARKRAVAKAWANHCAKAKSSTPLNEVEQLRKERQGVIKGLTNWQLTRALRENKGIGELNMKQLKEYSCLNKVKAV